jgi:hypothetical protein
VRRRRGAEGEQLAGALATAGGGGAEEAVGADLREAHGQDVLAEAGEEGVNRQDEATGLTGARADVAEGDSFAVEGLEAVVGQGDAMDVARQVLGGVVAVAGMLEVDGPGLAEDPRIEPGEQVHALEAVAHLARKISERA